MFSKRDLISFGSEDEVCCRSRFFATARSFFYNCLNSFWMTNLFLKFLDVLFPCLRQQTYRKGSVTSKGVCCNGCLSLRILIPCLSCKSLILAWYSCSNYESCTWENYYSLCSYFRAFSPFILISSFMSKSFLTGESRLGYSDSSGSESNAAFGFSWIGGSRDARLIS